MAHRSISDYPALQRVLESQEKIVYLCGAGASMSLGRHRNSWGTWLDTGKSRLLPAERAEFDALAGSCSTHELISAATYLLEHLKASGTYVDFMDETIGSLHPSDPVMTGAFQKICRAGDLTATTNYDLLLEEAVGSGWVSYEKPGEILPILNGTASNRVIHLHGVYDKAAGVDSIIADGKQYQTILENAGAQFIQNLLGTHPLMIVGCGGTVSDPNLSVFMQFVSGKLGLSVPYFYLMKEGDSAPPLPPNAIPVFYGTGHDHLPAFLDEAVSYRLRNRAEIRQLVQIDPYAAPKRLPSAFGRMHFSNRFSDFTGRRAEQEQLNRFLYAGDAVLWWGVLGEGGIGKSRLLLEWLKVLPANWYGFFARKDPKLFSGFIPFTDTVVVLDYILGEEEPAAITIAGLLRQFEHTPYRLRLILVERRQAAGEEDWLSKLSGCLPPEDRISFESCRCLNGAASPDTAEFLHLEAMSPEDERHYIRNYLNAYLPAFLKPAEAAAYQANLDAVGETIQKLFRKALEEPYWRPLYLSMFIEVWVNKAGAVDINGAKQLLRAYLEKETSRWKLILKDGRLVNAYLRLLAMACMTEQFNITDVSGENCLQEDCGRLSAFLDEQDRCPGTQSVFADLFVQQDELETFEPGDGLLSRIHGQLTQSGAPSLDEDPAPGKAPSGEESMSRDEAFAFLAPYIKLEAGPEEFYLCMLNEVRDLSEEESRWLAELREERVRRTAELPDYAWIIAPAFPDIIREYLVLHAVKLREAVPFTRLARANSVFGLGQFLTRAIEDWPEEPLFQKMLEIPPKDVLDYFEFYIPGLADARESRDFCQVEDILLQGEGTCLFARYEMELWGRIAIVLTERETWDRLLDSAGRFVQYVSKFYDHPRVWERAADILESYAVGLHNAAEAEKLAQFLDRCDKLAGNHPDMPGLVLFCCDNRARLIHLRRYLECVEAVEQDWTAIARHLASHLEDRAICLRGVEAAEEYFITLQRSGSDIYQPACELAALLERVYAKHPVLEAAEQLAIVTANLYMCTLQQTQSHSEDLFQKLQQIFKRFPGSKRMRSAYASVCGKMYAARENRTRDIPSKLMGKLEKWSAQYPDDIEFQEAFFDVTLYHLTYARGQGLRREELRAFRQLERIAKTANYAVYREENALLPRVEQLRQLFGYGPERG